MSIELRAVLYFIFLLYLFLGIAIIADIFMSSIETITSRKRKIRYPVPGEKDKYLTVEVRLWNDTVANLTLMALGSSSPEILLSIIEIIGNRFEAGELGPGTSKNIFTLFLIKIKDQFFVQIQSYRMLSKK
jgi:solute carrier family 8 (sodium/calcium exchanger)